VEIVNGCGEELEAVFINGGVFMVIPLLGDDDLYHPTWIAVVYGPAPDDENGLSCGAESPSFCVWAVPGTHSMIGQLSEGEVR